MSNAPIHPTSDRPGGCPMPEVLQRVAQDRASAAEDALVEAHLDECGDCRRRFDELLLACEEASNLRGAGLDLSEADLEAIRAAGVPPFPGAGIDNGQVVLSNGLRLALPRDRRYLARLGAYDVASVIGEGGMGVVLRGWDDRLQREVALKVISPRWLSDLVARARFLQEARSAAALEHPNIITIHAVEEDGDVPFIVMQYVRGKSLALAIAEEGRLKPVPALRIAREVLAALEHAHRQGIVHRDVKPGNILLEEASEAVRLVDFGLAKGVADAVRHTAEGSVPGTPWYMAPEQSSGLMGADPRSDLFSVGVVLYEMLVGTLPFPGHDVYQVLERIRSEETPDPCAMNPSIPTAVAEIVLHALQKDRNRRYQSASEFARAIDDYLSGAEQKTQPGMPAPIATTVAPSVVEPTRCSACSDVIASKLSVGGFCSQCEAPICSRCWKVRGVRHCTRHEPPKAPPQPKAPAKRPATPPVRKPEPRDALPHVSPEPPRERREPPAVNLTVTEVAQKPLEEEDRSDVPAQTSAAEPAMPPEEQLRAKHQTALEQIARARAEGRPAVSAYGAWLAEKRFVRTVEQRLEAIAEVADPCRGTKLPVKDWRKIRREAHRLLEMPSDSDSLETNCSAPVRYPSGVRLIHDVRARNLLGRLRGRVVIEALNLAHVERLAADGWDDQPVSREDLEVLLTGTVERAAKAGAWHLLILASPTGWTPEARQYAVGKGVHPFRDRWVSVVLYEDEPEGFGMDGLDEKLWPWRDVFDAELDEPTLARVRKHVEECLMVNNAIGLDALANELNISRRAAEKAFQVLASTGRFSVATVKDLGQFLSKID